MWTRDKHKAKKHNMFLAYSTDFYFAFVLLKTKTKFKNLKRCTFIIALKLGTHFREKRLLQWKNNM